MTHSLSLSLDGKMSADEAAHEGRYAGGDRRGGSASEEEEAAADEGDRRGSSASSSSSLSGSSSSKSPRRRGQSKPAANTKYAVRWKSIGRRLKNGRANVLPSYKALNLGPDDVLWHLDNLAKCLDDGCIPLALRKVPYWRRNWKWIFLNPVTPVFRLNPIKYLDHYIREIAEIFGIQEVRSMFKRLGPLIYISNIPPYPHLSGHPQLGEFDSSFFSR